MKRFWIVVIVILAIGLIAGGAAFAQGQKKTCRIWFWGEDEAVGITDWMNENAQLYNQLHPDVTWEVTHLNIDAIYTGLKAAMEAKDAPELHTVWGGLNTLQFAWTGEIVPISDYVSKDTISHLYAGEKSGTFWNGKLWGVGMYLDPWYLAINKTVWKAAGLDPNKLPTNWKDFISALKKVKAAGYIPFIAGMKDGYFADFFSSAMQYEYYDSVEGYHRGMLGQESLAKAPHDQWWYNVQELRDQGLFNKDASSLTLGEVVDAFNKGKAACTSMVQPQVVQAIAALGKDNVTVMVCPVPSNAKMKGTMPIPVNPLIIPAVAKYKEEAGKFIEFFLSPERQAALYEKTGVLPASDYIPDSAMKTQADQITLRLTKTKSSFTYQEHTPPAVLESLYAICQELVAGDIDARTAAQKYEAAAAKWRTENPKDVENYRKWAPESR